MNFINSVNVDAVNNIRTYLNEYGILSCNTNKYLPSLDDVGGDWNAIVHLIEQREVFHSKVFKGRTTYLSKEAYTLLKPYKQNVLGLSETSRKIYDFLIEFGQANTTIIKDMLLLSGKAFAQNFDVLQSRLLVTAIKTDNIINQSWSSFVWGTYLDWEKGTELSICENEQSSFRLTELLSKSLSLKDVKKLMQ